MLKPLGELVQEAQRVADDFRWAVAEREDGDFGGKLTDEIRVGGAGDDDVDRVVPAELTGVPERQVGGAASRELAGDDQQAIGGVCCIHGRHCLGTAAIALTMATEQWSMITDGRRDRTRRTFLAMERAMQAILLAGGKGTRLRPFTVTIPKPLLPLGDVPIVEVVIRQLAARGIRRIAVSLGHLAHLFSATIGDGSRFGVTIEYHVEEQPLGTAGPLRLIRDVGENVLVMNGDLLTTLDYRELIEAHLRSGAWATIAVRRRDVKIDLGVVVTSGDGRLLDYQEKPVYPFDVSMGIYVISRPCLELIPEEGAFNMPELLLAIKNAGQDVVTFKTDCYWQDIGRLDDYEQACIDFECEPERFLPDVAPRPDGH